MRKDAVSCLWGFGTWGTRGVGGRQQWQTQDAAIDILDVVVVLIIFFEAKLVHAL